MSSYVLTVLQFFFFEFIFIFFLLFFSSSLYCKKISFIYLLIYSCLLFI
ncbi:unnamed protein product [Brassica oleracea]